MKKALASLLVFVMLLTALPLGAVPVSAAKSGVTGDCTWELDDNGHLTISGDGAMKDSYQPWGTAITSVTIEEGVTAIGDWAFHGCGDLPSVTIPDSVISIGENAFYWCYNLATVSIGSGLTIIENGAFSCCEGLATVAVGNNVTVIGDSAFSGCISLVNINIPYSVTTIDANAFTDCSNLTEVILSANIKTIGEEAFRGCDSLRSITVATNNAYYVSEDGVLFNKDKTRLLQYPGGKGSDYVIPSSVTSIGMSAFAETNIRTVTIPDSVKVIDARAFSMSALATIDIPNSVSVISEHVFSYCINLTSIVIPSTVSSVGRCAFFNCENLSSVTLSNRMTVIEDYTFSQCYKLTAVAIPSNVLVIEEHAFEACRGLTAVAIGDKVKTIENHAFASCCSLQELHISDSVEVVGDYALDCCCNLQELYIGDGVNTIGEYAFSYCEKLVSVIIPNKVSEIGSFAFADCTSLRCVTFGASIEEIDGWWTFYNSNNLTTFNVHSDNQKFSSVDGVVFDKNRTKLILYPVARKGEYSIPAGVEIIGHRAFKLCQNLTSIVLADSVTTIEAAAFADCSNLALATLGKRITTINDEAFADCVALETVMVGENLISVKESAFARCDSLTRVFYAGSKERWAKIGFGVHNEDIRNATILYNSAIPFAVSASEHVVRVVNSSGEPIFNATVEVKRNNNIETHHTEPGGFIKFQKSSIGNINFTITADGYEPYTTVGKNFELDESGLDVIILYTPEEAGLKLVKATYQNTDSSYNEVLGKDVNLIKGTKRLSLFNKGRGYFRVLCSNSDTSLVEKYVLYQNGKIIATSQDGTFNLRIAWFEAGKGIYVTTFGKDGTSVSTSLNLEICDDETAKSVELSFGDKITFTVPDSIPFVGGSKIEYDIPDLPLQFGVEDGKVYAGLNINFTEDKSLKEQYEEIKQTMADVKKLSKYKVGSHLESNINKFLKKRDKFNLPVVGKTEVILFGGGEMTWSETGLDGMKLQAYLLIDLSLEKNWQTYYIVPITVNIKVGVEGKVSATIDWNFDTDTINGDVEINIKPYLNAFGGVGVGKWVGVGAYGEAEVDMGLQLFGTTMSPGVNYVDLTGELGLKVYVGPLTYSKSFAHNTWHIYTRTDALRRATNPRLYYADVFDSTNYAIDDVSYLDDQSVWLGNWSVNKRLLGGSDDGAISIHPLLLGTYRNLQPTIAATADDAVMVYVGADTDREAQNIATVMYSVYNPLTATWSEPIQVDSNLTADNAPMVYSDGEAIRLVYQDSSIEYGNDFSQGEYLTTQNIVIYKYDSATSKFVHEQTFEANGKQYRTPKLTEVNGVPALAWIESEDTDLFGQGDNNKFMCSYYRNGAWTEPAVLADGLCTIADYEVGESDGKIAVLYVSDADNDLGTDTDRSLVLLNSDGGKIISEGSALQLAFVKLPSEEAETFVWIADEMLYALNAGGEAQAVCPISSPESMTVVGNKILFTAAGGGNSEIYAVVYDESTDTYSTPVQISQQEKYIERLCGVDFNGAELLVMTRKEVTIGEDTVTDDCEFAWAVLNDQADLKVNSVEYDYDDIEDGEILLYLTVSNQGAAAAGSYTVSVKDADSNVVVEQAFDETFFAGETKDIVLMMPLDNITEIADYTVFIGESAESISDSQTMTIGYADLAVSTESIKVGNQNTLVCTVTNKGLSASSGELLVYNGTEDNVVSFAMIDSLAPGESKTFVVDLASETSERILTCAVKTDEEDYSEANNTESVYFDFSVFVEPECQHVYDDEHDADCNACGAIREVSVAISGDANGDGKVNNRDLGVLQRYINDWDVVIDLEAADLNDDGRVNNRDLGLLQQLLNK